jgi:hypothetical protein
MQSSKVKQADVCSHAQLPQLLRINAGGMMACIHKFALTEVMPEMRALKVTSLDLEDLTIRQVSLHDLKDRLREAHASERVPNFGVSVYLAELEQCFRDRGRKL